MEYILLLGEPCSSCQLPIDREVYDYKELGGGQCLSSQPRDAPTPHQLRQGYLFVGESRSERAKTLRVTWEDLALCSKTLHAALHAAEVTGSVQMLNLWDDAGRLRRGVFQHLRTQAAQGWQVVGLGKKVQASLRAHRIPHKALIHPAARGTIRRRDHYAAHVREVLLSAEVTHGA